MGGGEKLMLLHHKTPTGFIIKLYIKNIFIR